MNRYAKTRYLTLLAAALFLQGCTHVTARDQLIDIQKDMPSVTVVIDSVQKAINETAGSPAWGETSTYRLLTTQCKDEKKTGKTQCNQAYTDARTYCRKEAGQSASAVCGDFLREAAATCTSANQKPDVCGLAEAYAPLKIKSAKFSFSAVSGTVGEAGVQLWLLSGKATRKAGRSSSFEIVMAPRALAPGIEATSVPIVSLEQNLVEMLKVALEAANRCSSADDTNCPLIDAPQLGLRSAVYSIDIDYERAVSGGIAWTVGPATVSAGGGREQALGNTLVVELER